MDTIDIYYNEIKEKLLNFEIDKPGQCWYLAQFLVEKLGMSFYRHEIYYTYNDLNMRVKRIPIRRWIQESYILHHIGITQQSYKDLLNKKVNEAIWICDCKGVSFAEMLCEITKDFEYQNENDNSKDENYNKTSYMSGDEEAEECNRQFNSMMNDFDSWSNIDD